MLSVKSGPETSSLKAVTSRLILSDYFKEDHEKLF